MTNKYLPCNRPLNVNRLAMENNHSRRWLPSASLVLRRLFLSFRGRLCLCLCLTKPACSHTNMTRWKNGSNESSQEKVITSIQSWSSWILFEKTSDIELNLWKKKKRQNRGMTENTRRRNTCWDITLNQENKNILFLNPVEPTKMQACVFLPRRKR